MPPRTAEEYNEIGQKKLEHELRRVREPKAIIPKYINGHTPRKDDVIAIAMAWDRKNPEKAVQSKHSSNDNSEFHDEDDAALGVDDDASFEEEEEEDEYEDVVSNTRASSSGASIPQTLLDEISAKNDEWVRAIRKEYRIWKKKVTLTDEEDFLEPGTAPQSLIDRIERLSRRCINAENEEFRIRTEKAELEWQAEEINLGEFREWMRSEGAYDE
jgi:hypothetical protein